MSTCTAARLDALLTAGPRRVELLPGPTPLTRAPRLSGRLGVEILFKRDDLTSLAFGGNKVRALEYLVADALETGCDSLVTGAGPQSNWSMLAGLTALRHGLEPHLISYGDARPATGNLLLSARLGVAVQFTGRPDKESVDAAIEATAARLRSSGRRPYVIGRGGATPLGALGYARASREMCGQLDDLHVRPAAVWVATGSCGTQAGLAAGKALLRRDYEVVGVTVSRPAAECQDRVRAMAAAASDLLGGPPVTVPATVIDGWIGSGYGLASPAGEAAIDLVARTEGVFLDPVFGAKAMAALIDGCLSGAVTGPVVFVVTGGGPTLFAAPSAPDAVEVPVAKAGAEPG
jgi:D-cysteine desulfhydrase